LVATALHDQPCVAEATRGDRRAQPRDDPRIAGYRLGVRDRGNRIAGTTSF
jgi:hypothetical protein